MTDIEHSAESYETPPRMTKSPVIAPDAPTKSAIPLVLATKRHRHEMDPAMMTFNHAMRRNYNRPAFNRLRDRIGCKAATSDCSVVFNALYQSVIDRLVFNSMLIAGQSNTMNNSFSLADLSFCVYVCLTHHNYLSILYC